MGGRVSGIEIQGGGEVTVGSTMVTAGLGLVAKTVEKVGIAYPGVNVSFARPAAPLHV